MLWTVCRAARASRALVFAMPIIAGAQTSAADSSAHADQHPEPNPTQLLFAPTGRVLADGASSFGDTYLFLVHADHGLGNGISLGGGMSVLPTTHFTDNLFYVTPKIGLVQRPTFNVAVGATVGFAGHASGTAGAVYTIATSGAPDASLTYGVGWIFSQNQIQSQPGFMVGGLKQITGSSALISENYITIGNTNGALVSYGVRWFGEKLSVDLAFWNVAARNTNWYFPGLPYLAFALKF